MKAPDRNRLRWLVFWIILLLPFSLQAQEHPDPDKQLRSISGLVQDSATGEALGNVTIELRNPGEEKAFRFTLSDDNGLFEMPDVPAGARFQLTCTFTGYYEKILFLPARNTSIDVGIIRLVSFTRQLREVRVLGQKSIIEQGPDKLTYHVGLDPESKTSSLYDILQKVPFVSAGFDGELTMKGNTAYLVLVNGRPSALLAHNRSDVFRSLPASAIKSIELITNPPLRYAMQGITAIINITTVSNKTMGYTGGLNLNAGLPHQLSGNGSMTLGTENLDLSVGGGYSESDRPVATSTTKRIDKTNGSSLLQSGSRSSKGSSLNSSAEVSFRPGKLNSLTAGFSQTGSDGLDISLLNADLQDNAANQLRSYKTNNSTRSNAWGDELLLEYQQNARKNEARQIQLSYRLGHNTSRSAGSFLLQDHDQEKPMETFTSNEERLREEVVHLDLTLPVKGHAFELGGNYTDRESSSQFFYQQKDTLTALLLADSSHSDRFRYLEKIWSAYAAFRLRLQQWTLWGGGRLEQASLRGEFTSNGTLATPQYRNILPYLHVTIQLTGSSNLDLSYTSAVQRPALYYLNPYTDLSDPLNISFGNPGLRPALQQAILVNYAAIIRKTSLSMSGACRFSNGLVQQFTELGKDTVSRTTFGNIGRYSGLSFSANSNTRLGKTLGFAISSDVSYIRYGSSAGQQISSEGLTYSVSGSLRLQGNGWRAGAFAGYNTPDLLAQGKTSGYFSHSLNLTKQFLPKQQASIGFSAVNPFRRARRAGATIEDSRFHYERFSEMNFRQFNLTFSYRFVKIG
jgi:hypothetical protein